MKRSDTDMKDLEFIRKHVKVWPEGAESVRLDIDGDICFNGIDVVQHDFYPNDYDESMFNPNVKMFGIDAKSGVRYTHDEWLFVPQDLTTLDVPFGELNRDIQLRLVNHVLSGGHVEYENFGWYRLQLEHHEFTINTQLKYRAVAKQPTERETLEVKLHEQWAELNATMKRITEIK